MMLIVCGREHILLSDTTYNIFYRALENLANFNIVSLDILAAKCGE